MVNIYIKGQLLDQYDDEVIELTSSVLDVSDITKITGDFSKTFTIPASPNNNKLFRHWYNASIDDGFDARTKVEGHIDIDGVPFKIGKWRLSEVTFKDGVVDGYVVNFFGNLPDIKATIGDDKLSDLNFSKFDHKWNADNVEDGLEIGLFNNDVVYTPMANKRYFYDSSALAGDFDDININVAETGQGTGVRWNDLRPSIKAKTIIDAIHHKYGTGHRQVSILEITQLPSVSGLCQLNLNGNITAIGTIAGVNATDLALFMASFISTLDGYSATNTGAKIFITSDVAQEENLPTFNAYEATGMEVSITLDTAGAFGYENPIVFSNDFFDTTEFSEMYLWLKNDKDSNIGGGEVVIPYDTGAQTYFDFDNSVATYNTSWALNDKRGFRVFANVTDVTGFENVPYTLTAYIKTTKANGDIINRVVEKVAPVDSNGNVGTAAFSIYLNSDFLSTATHEVYYTIKTAQEFQYNSLVLSYPVINGAESPFVQNEVASSSFESMVTISEIMPDLNVETFLKGLFDMFKLVVLPKDDGTMYVNTLDSFYAQGKRHDITTRVDRQTYKVKRGTLYQTIGLKFSEPTTILNKEFKDRSKDKQGYGSSLVNIYEDLRPIKLIDGDKVDIKLPFEQILFERLTDGFTGELTSISTGTILDDKLAPVTPKPVLHYVSKQNLGTNRLKFVGANNVTKTISSMYVPLCQYGAESAMYSLSFENEISTWDYVALTNNLYSIHLESYYAGVFDIKRRIYEYDALLPTQLVTTLGLNDVLVVDSVDYRINKFKHNLLTGITKLELVNSFDTSLENQLFAPAEVVLPTEKQSVFFNLPEASSGYKISFIDIGDGKTWASANPYGSGDNILEISTTTDNLTGVDRSVELFLIGENGNTNKSLILTQKG